MGEPVEVPRSVSSLRDLRWHRRVLLGRSPAVDVSELWPVLHESRTDLDERGVVALVADGAGVRWWPQPPFEVSPDLGREIDGLVQGAARGLLLLGLDGGVKQRYDPATFSVAQLLADIDAMPMRLAERGRGR